MTHTTNQPQTPEPEGLRPSTPAAHQKADLKTEDEMQSVFNTFKAELFGNTHNLTAALRQYDSHALKLLRRRLSYIIMTIDDIRN